MVLWFYELLAFWNFVHMMSYFNQSEFTLVKDKAKWEAIKVKKKKKLLEFKFGLMTENGTRK